MTPFQERLNLILEKITSDGFLESRGLGNEISFHIFDYPPKEEQAMRQHLSFLLEHGPKKRPGLKIFHLDLWKFTIEYLQSAGLLDKSIEKQKKEGDAALLKALSGRLKEDKLAPLIAQKVMESSPSLVFLTGIGPVYPLIRGHSLFESLHSHLDKIPVILFYPGEYDGKSLKLFGTIESNNYYRAFRLIP